ncbi:MAG: hypothetical protein AAGF01_08790 [Cyanobacteria bacterium P01_G01_bin.38]
MVSLPQYSLSQYCEILQLDPATGGYKPQPLPQAKAFFDRKFRDIAEVSCPFPPEQHQLIQRTLFADFLIDSQPHHWEQIAQSGLCLRSRISYSILTACRKISARFAGYEGTARLRYQDLLPCVLDDDGRRLIVIEGTAYRELSAGELKALTFIPFTVEMLGRFDPQAQAQLNLDSWAYHQTQQHSEIRRLLSEQGFSLFTDWALLNRVGQQQLAQFSPPEQAIIQAFHAVYRRDRRQLARQQARQRCVEPSPAQLDEMLTHLKGAAPPDLTPPQLLSILKQIATQLRRQEIWRKRGAPVADSIDAKQAPWEIEDPATPLTQLETQDVRNACQQLLQQALQQGIAESIADHIQALQQRRKYAKFADRVVPALKLLYGEGKSQSEVAKALNLTNQSQVSRLLNLKQLLSRVRLKTLTQLVVLLGQQGLAPQPSDAVCAEPLVHRLEAFLDAEIFMPAIAELRTTKRAESLYAENLRQCLETGSLETDSPKTGSPETGHTETHYPCLEKPSEKKYKTVLSRGEK